jgi:hypothetical protein
MTIVVCESFYLQESQMGVTTSDSHLAFLPKLKKFFDQGAGVASTHYYKALARSWSWSCIHTLFERESEN